MATSFSDIYQRAMFRFRDFAFCQMNEADVGEVLRNYLNMALSDFSGVCLENLNDINEDGTGFQDTLSSEVQEILSLGIAFYWLSSKVLNQELLKNSLSTKDYTYFSPANLLRESQTLRDSLRKEYRDRIIQYTYRHGDIAMDEVTS